MLICQNSYPIKKILSGVVALVYNQMLICQNSYPIKKILSGVVALVYNQVCCQTLSNV